MLKSVLRFVFDNIEFRGKNHFSILPPSIVKGVPYKWISYTEKIPEMPKSLLKYYWKTKRFVEETKKKKRSNSYSFFQFA